MAEKQSRLDKFMQGVAVVVLLIVAVAAADYFTRWIDDLARIADALDRAYPK